MDQEKKTTEYLAETEEMYQTGRTEPPKSHGGIIAVLLGLVILLCGLTTALSLLNIRMFWQLNAPAVSSSEIALFFTRETAPATVAETEPVLAAPRPTEPKLDLFLETVPQETVPAPSEDVLSQEEVALEVLPEVPAFPLEQVSQQVGASIAMVESGSHRSTGIVLSADGYVLTGSAGLTGEQSIQVLLDGQQYSDATLIGKDELLGLAVLRVEATGLTPATFCDSSCLAEGDQIAALPSGSLTEVIQLLPGLLQTKASSAAGEPLVNCHGQVVGVSVGAGGMSQELSQALGFAVPSTTVKEVVERLIREYTPKEDPSLGIIAEAIPLFYQLYYELPDGFYITAVDSASDAFLKGISTGDILVSINGTPMADLEDISQAIQDYSPGETVSVVVHRSGKHYELIITLGEKE